jgi:FlaA1/EpsC-like NDP-sugar epimerase
MIRLLNQLAKPALALPRPAKRIVVLGVDVVLCIVSVWLAFYLRLGDFLPLSPDLYSSQAFVSLVSLVLAIPIFVKSGLYRAIFRYNGMPAMTAMVRAMLLYSVLFAGIFTFYGVSAVPRTVGLIQPVLLLVLVGASRAAARVWLGGLYQTLIQKSALPQVLIYGAGSAGRQLASAMANSHEMRVVGFLDDDDRLHGHVLNGLPIYNPVDLAEVLSEEPITDVLLALPSVARQRRNDILASLALHKVAVRTLPSLSDIATGKVSLSDVRELDIDDLLGRETVQPNALLLNRNTHRKTVLVTGAGGSIGSELCRQILQSQPSTLLLVDMSEFALYQIHQDLEALLAGMRSAQSAGAAQSQAVGTVEIIPLLASVCDEARMHEIMATWQPHTVYHAAAYKHVPLVEHNPAEGVRNNVWGTRVCALAAARCGVQNFVLVSTDKAVRPTNIMGASKRLAEMVLQALAAANPAALGPQAYSAEVRKAQRHGTSSHDAAVGGSERASPGRASSDGQGSDGQAPWALNSKARAPAVSNSPTVNPGTPSQAKPTCFSMVRFGNVLGSSGSVVPLFREQIKNGGPVTLTHADITRYFMTIPEAAQLVIQAGAMGAGGDVFVLDMGQPVRIIDLARRMVELSGLTIMDDRNPNGEIALAVTGLRPGEKLYEELLIGDNPKPTQHPRIMQAHEQLMPWPELEDKLNDLSLAISSNDVPAIRALLQQLVSGYEPSGGVVDWVHVALRGGAMFDPPQDTTDF